MKNYSAYFNEEAKELAKWSIAELEFGNRLKATRLDDVANKMEDKYRKKRGIPKDKNSYIDRNSIGIHATPVFFRPIPPGSNKSSKEYKNTLVKQYVEDNLPHLLEER